jgi:hypothetical protein
LLFLFQHARAFCVCLVSMSASQQASPIYLTRLPFAACSFGVAAGCTYRYSDGREPGSQPAQCAPRQISINFAHARANTSREEAAGSWCARERVRYLARRPDRERELAITHARVSSARGLLRLATAARTYLVTRGRDRAVSRDDGQAEDTWRLRPRQRAQRGWRHAHTTCVHGA